MTGQEGAYGREPSTAVFVRRVKPGLEAQYESLAPHISMVDTRDVAAVAAVLLTQPGHEGSEHDVTGPEALSYADVASKLSAALGRQINYVNVPDDAVRGALSGFGLGQWMADSLVNRYEDYRRSGTDGYAARVTDTVARLVGRPARTLDELLAEQQGGTAVRT